MVNSSTYAFDILGQFKFRGRRNGKNIMAVVCLSHNVFILQVTHCVRKADLCIGQRVRPDQDAVSEQWLLGKLVISSNKNVNLLLDR